MQQPVMFVMPACPASFRLVRNRKERFSMRVFAESRYDPASGNDSLKIRNLNHL